MPILKHELRLGSHIQHATILELYREQALIQLFDGSHQHVKYSDLEALPVTEGYLTIAGFEPWEGGWHRAGLHLVRESTGFYMRQSSGYVSKDPITTVHRLENLYHALTGHILPDNIDERDDLNQSN